MTAEAYNLELVKIGISVLGGLVAIIGAAVALRNWRIANETALNTARWKRAELGATYREPLLKDEELIFALRCIDWSVGRFPVPEKYQKMVGDDFIIHSDALLQKAMAANLTGEIVQSPQLMLYRLSLDALFTRVEWIGHRIESRLISLQDVPDLVDWPIMMAARKGPDGMPMFVPLLREFRYMKTIALMQQCGRGGASTHAPPSPWWTRP